MDIATPREMSDALNISDPPVDSIDDIWAPASQMATVGIFLILLVGLFYFCRPVLLPVTAAFVVGMTLAPAIKRARNIGIPPWVSASFISLLLVQDSAHVSE